MWRLSTAPAVLTLLPSCSGPREPVRDFQGFWSEFRAAALAGHMTKLATMTRFPLEVREPMDDDPVEHCNGDEFPATFARILGQDSGMRPEPETVRQYLERMPITGSHAPADLTVRVADLVFKRVDGHWLLLRVHRSE